MILSWDEIKSLIDSEQVALKYIERFNEYSIVAIADGFQATCAFDKGSADALDFEQNYQPLVAKVAKKDANGRAITKTDPLVSSGNLIFGGKGCQFLSTASQTVNHYLVITSVCAFNGVAVILRNHAFGDSMTLRIESDGTVPAYGAEGTILNTFGSDWCVDYERAAQTPIVLPYKGTLTPGMRINLRYASMGNTNVDVLVNYFLHVEI